MFVCTRFIIQKMNLKFGKLVIVLTLGFLAKSLTVDSNDLLNGNGLFNTAGLTNFVQDHHHTINFLTVNSTNVLKLEKPATGQVSFDTGLEYNIIPSQPVHVSFEFSSVNTDTQDANLRLIDTTTGNTVLLFRAGKAGFIRVNDNQMISFYNSSVSTDSNVKTIKMDILLDWSSAMVNVFVNGEWKGKANFFQKANSVNKIRLYNLYQSTSYWKNLVVCTQNCYSFTSESILKSTFGVAFGLLFLLLISV